MDWWIGELVKILVLIILAVGLHQFIRRFGKSYAADIFQSSPQLRRVFLVLADVAYYLIFAAYILFNVHFERADNWGATVNASQLENIVFSMAGISLIIGILHGINVFVLPFIGSILALRARLAEPRQEVLLSGR